MLESLRTYVIAQDIKLHSEALDLGHCSGPLLGDRSSKALLWGIRLTFQYMNSDNKDSVSGL